MIVRIGKVTNIHAKQGKVTVTYTDLGKTSRPLPCMTFGGEYKLPKIGDTVLTLHLQNGSSKGFVLGTFWSDVNKPKETGEQVYYRELENDAYEKQDGRELRLYSPDLILMCEKGEVTIEQLLALMEKADNLERRIAALEGRIS